ncbi:TPM domain-containing protein [[Haemophilus] ducreyi]|uniref:TPM domain-containing protein n=1 Tax=Haemophilus ducreyi TaxID=730 RepID=UPI000654CD37|nr:TPM domain-containing protein [[Haemophilus] ducreyi]AKO45080.1 methanol dehydrogenase [[Haemophilus] ducreyi]AKO46482.1 methanol dehydrogenase [[Haemophilus] ducreyi]AKO47824.1 methanol dehydrogenase [[Haemophilus] ducreyi]AKO49211.1 methanol dehydrogenase [[Haemophilus] ducreyi]ANF62261.1 methanol dehydrogenase [[Haemophilus] ducreyi]
MIKLIYKPLWLILLIFFSFKAIAEDHYPTAPSPFYYVSDYTKTLNQQEWRTLEDALINNRSKTSSQIIVVMIPSTDGEEIARYAHNLFNKWGIGRIKHNENNGVLLLIAKNDRKLFIATGRGLESALPDAIAATIIRHHITPYFKQNLYAEGIASGLSAIMAAINGEFAAYDEYQSSNNQTLDGFFFFLFAAFVIFMMFRPTRNSQYISRSNTEPFQQILRHSRYHHDTSRDLYRGGSGDSFGGGSSGGGGAGGSW